MGIDSPSGAAFWLALGEAAWIATPEFGADHRGPLDRPCVAFGDPAASPSLWTRLCAVGAQRSAAAVIADARGTVTFTDLVSAVLRLAARLDTAPQTAGPIAILLPMDRDYVVAVYACLVAGRISLLLDAAFPPARNAAIATAAQVQLALVPADGPAPDWPGVALLRIAAADDPAGGNSGYPTEHTADLDAPAFILCTSGSSGLPKLIVHSQRTMLHWARVSHDALHITPEDWVLSLSSLSALAGFTQMLSVPLGGGALQMFDIKSGGINGLIDALTGSPITIVRGAPSLLRGIARLPDARAIFSGLRVVQTYGEVLTMADLRALRAVLPARCFVRATYGATEASGIIWYAREDDRQDPLRVAAGRLMPDTAAVILDDDGRPCARGDTGELVLRSRYNALGEWRSGAVVAGRMEADPFDPLRRIYRTGDLARCDLDGVFVVLGRKDRMLNINGQRAEPAEVERVLRSHALVDQAEVLAHARKGAATMVGFVVPKAGAAAGAAAGLDATLRTLLRSTLPSFMMPSRILLLDAIPLLPGGKVNALALLALAADPASGSAS